MEEDFLELLPVKIENCRCRWIAYVVIASFQGVLQFIPTGDLITCSLNSSAKEEKERQKNKSIRKSFIMTTDLI